MSTQPHVFEDLRSLGIFVEEPGLITEAVLRDLLALAKEEGPVASPAHIRAGTRLTAAVRLGAGCDVAGFLGRGVSLEEGCTIGPFARLEETHCGKGCRVEGSVENSLLGEEVEVAAGARIVESRLGSRSRAGGEVLQCQLGEENEWTGFFQHVSSGARAHLRGRLERCKVGDNVVVADSQCLESYLGDGTSVTAFSRVENSWLVPFARQCAGKTDWYAVKVRNARVTKSLVWGGTDINDGSVIREFCVVGPFVHIGIGCETKAAYLRGASPQATVEIAHRNYLGNTAVLIPKLEENREEGGWFTTLEQLMLALLKGTLVETEQDSLAPGGFHEPQRLVFEVNGKPVEVEAEGINIGALLTTSNFDPRNGGVKWPTIIESGVKCGILTQAQAPVVIPEGTLLASGSKIAGRKTPRGSIVLSGIGRSVVKKGHVIENRGILGEGIEEKIEVTLLYLRMVRSLWEAAGSAGSLSEGIEAKAWAGERFILARQALELFGWLERFLAMVGPSHERLKEALARKVEEEATPVSARLLEHERVMERLPALLAEVASLRQTAEAIPPPPLP